MNNIVRCSWLQAAPLRIRMPPDRGATVVTMPPKTGMTAAVRAAIGISRATARRHRARPEIPRRRRDRRKPRLSINLPYQGDGTVPGIIQVNCFD